MNHEPFDWNKFFKRVVLIPGLVLIAIVTILSMIFPSIALDSILVGGSSGSIAFNVFMAIMWAIIYILILALIYGVFLVWLAERISFSSSIELTAFAKVISKTSNTIVRRTTKGVPTSSTRHFIGFEFQDGTRKTIPVNVSQFSTILENEAGTLTYREYGTQYLWFVKFQRQV